MLSKRWAAQTALKYIASCVAKCNLKAYISAKTARPWAYKLAQLLRIKNL